MRLLHRQLRCTAACCALVLGATAAGVAQVRAAEGVQFSLPDFGSSADTLLTTGQEQRLGRAFMHSVHKSLPVIVDPLLNSYIVDLGERLVEASGEGGRHFRFFLIDEPVINAFAGPNGYIGIYAGLVLAAQTESELAAVVAHEIAHVAQRHLMRAFEDTRKMSLPATALLIGAAILGAQVSSDAGAAAVAGLQAAAVQRQINFTRDNEKEADRLGIAMLADAGYSPYAMAGFFERLSKVSRIQDTEAPEMLRTHPVTTNRISDALGRAEGYGHRQRPDSLRFHLVRADLRQRTYSRAEKAVAHFRATLREGRYASETAERYGYALALFRAGQYQLARDEVGVLLEAHPIQEEFVVLAARLDLQAGKADRALKRLREALGLSPASLPLRIAYGEALIETGRPALALKTLEEVVGTTVAGPAFYELMAEAAVKAKDPGATYRYRAEQHYALGEIEPAIRQLEVALRQRELSYLEASRIQARLAELKEEQRLVEDDPWSD